MRTATSLLGLFGLASAQDMKIIMENKSPGQDLGMYWLGTEEGPAGAAHVVGTGGGRETFLESISPGKKIAHTAKYGDRFVFRTAEFGGFRAAVQVQRGTGKRVDGRTVKFPFSFTFQAIGAEKSAGHLELKHGGNSPGSKPEYIWINRGQQVSHLTEGFQTFTLRNADRKDMISFSLMSLRGEL